MHTILTALLDCDSNVQKTADSLLNQLNPDVTWIIKNSKKTKTKYLEELSENPYIKLICKADSSLYEGLNQGLEECNSEFVQIVGAGDIFYDNAIKKILNAEKNISEVDSIFFPVIQLKNQRPIIPNPKEMQYRMACPHPGSILRTLNIKKIGSFNQCFRIASDYDLLSRYLLQFPKFATSDDFILGYMGGGISEKSVVEAFLEEELIRLRIWNCTQNETIINSYKFMSWAKNQLNL